jgi:hypothetical protein
MHWRSLLRTVLADFLQQYWLEQWLLDYVDETDGHTDLGLSSNTWPTTSRAILSWSSLILSLPRVRNCALVNYVGPVLTNVERRVRVRWCHILKVWTLRNWCRIWFSGESRFFLQRCDGRTWEQVSKWVFRSCLRTRNWQWVAISYNRWTN